MMPAIVIEPIEPSNGRSKAPNSFVCNRNHRDNRGRAGGQGTRTSRAASGTRFSTVLGGAAAQLTAHGPRRGPGWAGGAPRERRELGTQSQARTHTIGPIHHTAPIGTQTPQTPLRRDVRAERRSSDFSNRIPYDNYILLNHLCAHLRSGHILLLRTPIAAARDNAVARQTARAQGRTGRPRLGFPLSSVPHWGRARGIKS